jgi:hypothetical protein
MAGVGFLIAEMRKVRGRDLENIGPVFRECPSGDRPRQESCEIKHANAGERPRAGGQRLGRTVTDPDNLKQRQHRNRAGLRMFGPFSFGTHHAASTAGGDQRFFKVKRIPSGQCPRDTFARAVAAEHLQRRRKMVREIRVKVSPAPIPRWIDSHDRVPLIRNGAIPKPHIEAAPERGRGVMQVDGNCLGTAGPLLPKLGCGKASHGDRSRAGCRNAKGGRQQRVRTPREADGIWSLAR